MIWDRRPGNGEGLIFLVLGRSSAQPPRTTDGVSQFHVPNGSGCSRRLVRGGSGARSGRSSCGAAAAVSASHLVWFGGAAPRGLPLGERISAVGLGSSTRVAGFGSFGSVRRGLLL